MTALGERIRMHRRRLGYTQEQLAEALGVTVGAVSKWETDSTTPELEMILELADLFQISVDALLDYRMQEAGITQTAERIHEFRKKKKYEEGCREAQKALLRYPNCFEIVYHSALLYEMKGIEHRDKKALQQAEKLLKRSLVLLNQNRDPRINEMSIQDALTDISISLGETEKALEELKKRNVDMRYSAEIGYLLSSPTVGRYREALVYLSEGMAVHLTAILCRPV